MPSSTTKPKNKISFRQFMALLNNLKSSTCCVNENHSFYVYRVDTNQVLARGLDGFEAAKSRANQIRQQHNLKWNQVKFKMEPKQRSSGSGGTDNGNKSNQTGYYDRSKVYNPSKRGYFRGYFGADGSYADID
jgi:hypothetical protein